MSLALLPNSCAKVLGKKGVEAETDPGPVVPTPVPLTSATTPPVWHPPEASATPTVTATTSALSPPAGPELVKARAAFDAREFKKVKQLLEKRVLKAGAKGSGGGEEATLLYRACLALKDKACADAVKARHPEDATE